MPSDPLRYFRVEARELIDQISQGVLDLGQAPGPELVGRLLRFAHTLKGAARVVRQGDIADSAHAFEEILVAHRDRTDPLPQTAITELLRLADEIGAAVAGLAPAPVDEPADAGGDPPGVSARGPGVSDPGPGVSGPGPSARAPADPAAGQRAAMEPVATTRPEAGDVDELLDAVGEVHTRSAPLRRATATLERARRTADAVADQLRGRLTDTAGYESQGPVHHPARPSAVRLAAELASLARQLTDTVEQVERELDEVRGRAERLRLVAAAGIFTSLHRAVRDVADAQGKRVVFASRGGDLQLDPQVLAQASSALLHVVRNAVAHGIEPEPERLAAGKPGEGRVTVEVVRRGRYAAFQCRDDGRGFDLPAVRRAAEAKGLIPPGTGAPGQRELVDLVLHGGISTSPSVTAVSGRGIGLDVVRDVAEQLGGEVSVSTEPGVGTAVELVVPLSLVSVHGLLVVTAGRTVSLPLDAVRTCVRLTAGQHADAISAAALPHAGQVIPFLPLAQALFRTSAQPPAAGAVAVVVAAGPQLVALGVDGLLGTSTMVVRPLPELTPPDPVVGGVTIDAEGNPRLMLDPVGIVAQAGRAAGNGLGGSAQPDASATPHDPILVIDDSLTTRMLERSILESAGYSVDLAASAEEALDKARNRRYALFLTDIDMPGIDGFTFVGLTRADPELRDVPAILVSSRASAEDRRRGAAAGASAYVVKSEFNQHELLSLIETLVPSTGAVEVVQ